MKGEATEKYLSTGEFARICGVEKHVLFHYEEIGLFQPVLVLENGYRYYSYHQYDTFVVIRLLRSLGMSLRDIGVYLDQRTPERFLALLREKDRELAREIRRLEDTRRTLDRISAMVSEVIGGEKGVHLERLPAARRCRRISRIPPTAALPPICSSTSPFPRKCIPPCRNSSAVC